MHRISMTPLLIGWLPKVMLFAGYVCVATLSIPKAFSQENPASVNTLKLRYENGLIDAGIDSVPLGQALHALAFKTGIQINSIDPNIASWPVSASVQAIPLEQGIKEILDGFSYAIYPVADTPAIIVLSTPPNLARTGLKSSGPGLKYPLLPATPDKASHTTKDHDSAPISHTSRERVPQSLDEFQPITIEEVSSDTEADGDQDVDLSARSVQDQDHNEALLQRALEAMKSKHNHLYIEAMDQLAGAEDPRATEALMEASNNSDLDAQSRFRAVAALSQHARNSQFADAALVNALRQLAGDSDENVRSIAHQALRDMQQYQGKTAAR